MSEKNWEGEKASSEEREVELTNGECAELVKARSRSRRGGSESEVGAETAVYSLGMAEQILRASPERTKQKVNFSINPSECHGPSTTTMSTLLEENMTKNSESRLYGSQSASAAVGSGGGGSQRPPTGSVSTSNVSQPKAERTSVVENHQQHVRSKEFAKKRSRSLCAPNPKFDFGPKASIMKSCLGLTTVQDPSTLRLNWDEPPETVLVMKKQFDNSIVPHFKHLLHFLVAEKKLTVFVEESVVEENLGQDPSFEAIKDQINIFSSEHACKIDLLICMGGDGTLLHANSIFQHSVPPILSFHLGSLGFLMPFDFSHYRSEISRTLAGDVPLVLRSRLKGVIMKRHPESQSIAHADSRTPQQQKQQQQQQHHQQQQQQQDSPMHKKSAAKMNGLPRKSAFEETDEEDMTKGDANDDSVFTDRHMSVSSVESATSSASVSPPASPPTRASFLVLNEIVIDRGMSAFISNVDLYLNGRLITRVQGDGLIISTPTGSTAYALAAGSSMVHPSVQSILITPICPHSLSFRPISVPAGVELKVMLSPEARNSAWVSFDGRNRQELSHGDVLRITTSVHPVPSISKTDQLHDWFESLADCLHWNVRQPQKALEPQPSDLPASISSSSLESFSQH